jgi:hypothetical protein
MKKLVRRVKYEKAAPFPIIQPMLTVTLASILNSCSDSRPIVQLTKSDRESGRTFSVELKNLKKGFCVNISTLKLSGSITYC